MSRGAQQLADFRSEHGLTQMAMAIKLGCHTQEVSAYEKGTRTPGRERALKLREVAGILIDAWDDPVEEAPEKPSEAVS